MFIREYEPADREACMEIFKSNIPLYFASEELQGFTTWLDKDMPARQAEKGITRYYVLEEDHRLVACAGFHVDREENQAGMIWGMVHRDDHRKGYGRKLLEFRIEKIRSLNPEARILLDTSQHVYRFFEKMGFSVIKIVRDYYAAGMDRYDMVG